MKKKQRCYIYTRVSTAIQVDGYSLDAQRDKLIKYAEYQEMEIAQEYRFRIHAMEIMPDHIHMLVDCRPQFYIPDMVKIMKGNTARRLFLERPELKKELWGGHLWNPSYCVVTVSDRSYDQVKEYIDHQKKE